MGRFYYVFVAGRRQLRHGPSPKGIYGVAGGSVCGDPSWPLVRATHIPRTRTLVRTLKRSLRVLAWTSSDPNEIMTRTIKKPNVGRYDRVLRIRLTEIHTIGMMYRT